jgi:tRNA threonylcarbamoyladenosine dehydratase
VGSWAVESLARSGVGNLTLVDLDEICLTNVNRQLHAMDGHIGRQKAEAMAERARAIHPAAEVTIVPRFFTAHTAEEILAAGFDAVIDAIDTTLHKALLLAACRTRGIFTVTCGGAGGRRDPSRIRVADLAYSGKDPLLHQLRRSLRQDHDFPKTPMGCKPDPLGIEAVFSDESPVFLQCDGGVSNERPPNGGGPRLGCESGLGSVTHVTASFGMTAAGRVLEHLAAKASLL